MNLWNVLTLQTVIKRKCSLQITVMFPDTLLTTLLTAPALPPIIQKLCWRKEVGSVAGSSPTWLGLRDPRPGQAGAGGPQLKTETQQGSPGSLR